MIKKNNLTYDDFEESDNEEDKTQSITPINKNELINNNLDNSINKINIENATIYNNYNNAIQSLNNKNQILLKWGMISNKYYLFNNYSDVYNTIHKYKDDHLLFNEVLYEKNPLKMFCDIDVYNLNINKIDLIKKFNNIIKSAFNKFNFDEFKEDKIKLTMSKGDKISFHWIYHNKKIFRDYKDQKTFWNYIYDYINKYHKELCYDYITKDKKTIKLSLR